MPKGIITMQIRLIASSIALCIVFGCSENPTTIGNDEKHGYSLSAFFVDDISDSTLCIIIKFDGIQYEFPKISINNRQIDTGYYPDHFAHRIADFSGNSFHYSIEIDNDKIEDSIVIPKRITSIYCNGQLLKDTISVTIDSSSAYTFSWNRTMNSNLYLMHLYSNISKSVDQLSSDTSVTMIPTLSPPPEYGRSGGLHVWGVSYSEFVFKSKPNKESDKQFVYYDCIRGPCKYVCFSIQ